jgi:hypothetical protein
LQLSQPTQNNIIANNSISTGQLELLTTKQYYSKNQYPAKRDLPDLADPRGSKSSKSSSPRSSSFGALEDLDGLKPLFGDVFKAESLFLHSTRRKVILETRKTCNKKKSDHILD